MVSLKEKIKFHQKTLYQAVGDTQLTKDVKEAIDDFLFILDSWNKQDGGVFIASKELEKVCEKYGLNFNIVIEQDISTEELFEAIFGDWKE